MRFERLLVFAFIISATPLAIAFLQSWSHKVGVERTRGVIALLWTIVILTCATTTAQRASGSVREVGIALHRYGGPSLTLVLMAWALATPAPKRSEPSHLVWVAALAYGGAVIASSAVNRQLPSQIPAGRALPVLYLPLLAHVILGARVRSADLLRLGHRISLAVVYASLVLAIVAPNVAFLAGAQGKRRLPIGAIAERLAGVGTHPLDLSIVAGVALLMSLKRSKARSVHIASSISVIVLAEAREVGVALLVAGLVYVLFSSRSPTGRLILLSPAIILLTVLTVQLAGTSSSLTRDVDTLNGRTSIWSVTADSFGTRPFLGWGPQAFESSGTPFSGLRNNNAHNQFAQALIEAGIVGLLAQLVMLVALVMLGWRTSSIAVFPAFLAFVILTSLTNVPFTTALYGFSFYVTIGICLLAVVGGASDGQRDATLRASLDENVLADHEDLCSGAQMVLGRR